MIHKKRRKKAYFLFAAFVCLCILALPPGSAVQASFHEPEHFDYIYSAEGGYLYFDAKLRAIVGCDREVTSAVIPAVIHGIPVESIEQDAFSYCSRLQSVSIPEGVQIIREGSFSGCSSLKEVVVPASVKIIGKQAFYHCSGLERVVLSEGLELIRESAFEGCTALKNAALPDSVLTIEERAFQGCTALETVKLPSRVKSIGGGAFAGTALTTVTIPASATDLELLAFSNKRMEAIWVDEKNPAYTSVDGVLMNKQKTMLIQYPAGKPETAYVVPETVTEMDYWAFSGTLLEEITLPEGLMAIPAAAFLNSSALKKVHIPSSVTKIEDGAFMSCTALERMELPDTVKEIGYKLFKGCTSLREVRLPFGITEIPSSTFSGCSALEEFEVPMTVIEIGSEAFAECPGLKRLLLPISVQTIGRGALWNSEAVTIQCMPGSYVQKYVVENEIAHELLLDSPAAISAQTEEMDQSVWKKIEWIH